MNKKSKMDESSVEFRRWFVERADPTEEARRLRGIEALIAAIFGDDEELVSS